MSACGSNAVCHDSKKLFRISPISSKGLRAVENCFKNDKRLTIKVLNERIKSFDYRLRISCHLKHAKPFERQNIVIKFCINKPDRYVWVCYAIFSLLYDRGYCISRHYSKSNSYHRLMITIMIMSAWNLFKAELNKTV